MIGFIRASAAIFTRPARQAAPHNIPEAAEINTQPPAHPHSRSSQGLDLPAPQKRSQPSDDHRFNREMATRTTVLAGDVPPLEIRASWPVQLRRELEQLADLTAVQSGPWRAAQLMDWRR